MSCLRYRKIRNPIDSVRSGFLDKSYISIPDCRCSKCRKAKQNDWLVRSYFEYTSKPTTAFFVTLDFDDVHLPMCDGIPCFDSQLMTNFFEILRQLPQLPSFRYLYASDYGGYLERPHYHCIFLFDKDSISYDDFSAILTFYWKYGSHENIQKINTRYAGNPFKCFEYVCKYTLKDLSFAVRTRESTLPKRFRSLTSASVGYGAQCMDPAEFNSSRLIRAGVRFNEVPTITRDYMLENSVIFLDIKNNGCLVPFSIPRYYELKLMYDYHYNSDTKKVYQPKNSYGAELSDIRHKVHYVQLYHDILVSSSQDIFDNKVRIWFNSFFPDSPYNGLAWSDIVKDVSLNETDFYEVCKVYDFLDFYTCKQNRYISVPKVYENSNTKYKFVLHNYGCYGSRKHAIAYHKIDLYLHCIFIYNLSKSLKNLRLAHFDDWEQKESNKARLMENLKRKPFLRRYLYHKHFNFSKLKFQPYVPFD